MLYKLRLRSLSYLNVRRADVYMRELQQGILGMSISLKLVYNLHVTNVPKKFNRLAFQIKKNTL